MSAVAQTQDEVMSEWQRLLATKEALLPELALHVSKAGVWPALRHPLVYAIPYMEIENALLNKRLRVKREYVAKAIRARKWGEVIMLHERPYRAQALMSVRNAMPDATDYWPLVGEVWSDTENFWQERPLWRVLLTSPKRWMLERPLMMSERERATYAALPGKLTVYRGGHSKHRRAAQTGYSWTTDLEVARRFAGRYLRDGKAGDVGVVYEREVFKRDVIATLSGRNEHEVVLSPEVLVPGRNACRLVERVGR